MLISENSISRCFAESFCDGRVRTKEDSVEIVKNQYHFHDPTDMEKRKCRKPLVDRAKVSAVTPQLTIFDAQSDVIRETAARFPSYSANQRNLIRVRREKRPKMAEPTSLTVFEIPVPL